MGDSLYFPNVQPRDVSNSRKLCCTCRENPGRNLTKARVAAALATVRPDVAAHRQPFEEFQGRGRERCTVTQLTKKGPWFFDPHTMTWEEHHGHQFGLPRHAQRLR